MKRSLLKPNKIEEAPQTLTTKLQQYVPTEKMQILTEQERDIIYNEVQRENIDIYAVKLMRRIIDLLPSARKIIQENNNQKYIYSIAGLDFHLVKTTATLAERSLFGLNNDFWNPVLDWLRSMGITDLSRFNLDDLYNQQLEWHNNIQAALQESFERSNQPPVYISNDVVYEFSGEYEGWKVVRISRSTINNYKIIENDLKVEGYKMKHCVGTYAERVVRQQVDIYSLRDPANEPHITASVDPLTREINEIRGNSNSEPAPQYIPMIKEWCQVSNIHIILHVSCSFSFSSPKIDKTINNIEDFYVDRYITEEQINKIVNAVASEVIRVFIYPEAHNIISGKVNNINTSKIRAIISRIKNKDNLDVVIQSLREATNIAIQDKIYPHGQNPELAHTCMTTRPMEHPNTLEHLYPAAVEFLKKKNVLAGLAKAGYDVSSDTLYDKNSELYHAIYRCLARHVDEIINFIKQKYMNDVLNVIKWFIKQ